MSMELKPSNRDILEQLSHGSARFELVSDSNSSTLLPATFLGATQRKSHLFFAKAFDSRTRSQERPELEPYDGGKVTKDRTFSMWNSLPSQQHVVDKVTINRSTSLDRSTSLGATKVKQYVVDRVTEDSRRSLFRALAKGIGLNEDCTINADKLQKDVKEAICNDPKEKEKYNEAIAAIAVKDSLTGYCERFGGEDFWGGKSELLVLSKLYKQPIMVYLYEHEHASGVTPIAEYGAEFRGGWRKGKKKRNVVRLLYSVEKNHYDLLH